MPSNSASRFTTMAVDLMRTPPSPANPSAWLECKNEPSCSMGSSELQELRAAGQPLPCGFLCLPIFSPSTPEMKILIADDHAVFRRGLKETIAEAFHRVTFGEAATAQETLECVQQQGWDMVVLDISMPGKSGLEILGDLKRLRPRLPVLFLSVHPEEQYARRALKSGAAGYVTKESVPSELKEAVRRVLAGGHYVSATLAERLAVDLMTGSDLPIHELLSDREFEVLRM